MADTRIGERFVGGQPVTRAEFTSFYDSMQIQRDPSGQPIIPGGLGVMLALTGFPPDRIEQVVAGMAPQDFGNADAFARALARLNGKPLTIDAAASDPAAGAYTTAATPGALLAGQTRTSFDANGQPVTQPVVATAVTPGTDTVAGALTEPAVAATDPRATVSANFLANFTAATDPSAPAGTARLEPMRFAQAQAQALGLNSHNLTTEEKMQFQQFLKDTLNLGDDFQVDGKFGTQTRQYAEQLRAVVREQQTAAGLTGAAADGLAGDNTLAAIRNRAATPTPG